MSLIVDALERIRSWLQQNYPAIASFPHPGLTPTQIQDITKNLPFQVSEEVYELYQWRNGTKYGHIFFPFTTFYSLEESLKISQFKIEEKSFYPYGLIIFSTDRHLYYVKSSDEQNKFSAIWRTNEDRESEICYVNLTNLIGAIAECYETGAYYVKHGTRLKFLQEDRVKSESIFSKYNSGLSFHSPL
jgi:SMI1 / KNR4 family (SUKH-1)